MIKRKKTTTRRTVKNVAPKNCYFCGENKEPDFADTAVLKRFLTERGKIVPRSRNGLCAKHQKGASLSIKHARQLALLAFNNRI